jgi:trimethylamine--corrinoid protein Co-methyltransferase
MSTNPDRPNRGRSREALIAARRSGARSAAVRPGLHGGLYRPLSEHDIRQIADTAFRILEELGFGAFTDEVRDYALAGGAHLNAEGRLCFPRALVEDLLAGASREIVYHGRDEARTIRSGGNRVYFATSGEAVRVVDPITGRYRPSQLLDLYDFFRMADHLDHIDFCGQTVVANDLCEDARLHSLNIAYAGTAATTKPFSISLADPETVRDVESLFDEVLGGEGRFRERPFAAIGVCPVVSPLRFGPDTSAVLCEAARRGLPISACTAPQSGATAPAALAGALAQCTAEALAIVILANLINPGHPIDFGPWTFVADLRTGAFTGGSGEEAILQAAAAQLARHFGLPGVVAAGMTDSKRPDYQAGYEKGMTIALSALAGGNMICESAGMMGSLMGCSLESMLLDNDLIGAVQRTLRGIEVSEETLSFDVIAATVRGPAHFLGAPQTLSLMQSEYLYPEMGDRTSLSEWEFRGSPHLMERARVRVGEIMASHYPQYLSIETDAHIRSRFDIRLPRYYMQVGNDRWPSGA